MTGDGKWQDRVTETRRMRVGDLLPYKYNPKRHPASQMARIEAVLEKFGKVQGVIAWYSQRNGGKLTTFDGNARRNLDPDETWLVNVTNLDDAEVDELVFYFDPLAGMSLHDEAKMTALMQDLGDVDGVLGEMLGELAEGVGLAFGGDGDGPQDPGPQLDKAAELQEVWRVKRGQVWEISSHSVPGKAHRLMCGDSTDAGDVGRLTGGEQFDSMVTDPPFFTPATHYQSRVKHQRKFSDLSSLAGFWELVMQRICVHQKQESHVIVFCNCDSYAVFYPVMFSRFDKTKSLVWDKNRIGLGRIFRHQHELMIWGRNEKHYFDPDGELRADVLAFDATLSRDREHPVEKPPGLLAALIKPLTPLGGIVLEPFAGSGTTLVGAEAVARLCYAMDLDVSYCAVSLDRLQRLGLEPRLVEE